MEGTRYFANPFFDNASKGAAISTNEFLAENIAHLKNKLTLHDIPIEEARTGGPYTGVAGIGYALLRESAGYSQMCENYVSAQLEHSSSSRSTRYLTGTVGLLTIKAINDHRTGKPIDAILAKFRQMAVDVDRFEEDEILNGRAGFLAAILEIRLLTKEKFLRDDEIRRVLTTMISSGRRYSASQKSQARLMYEWHEKEYLGAAHGVSGIYQILVSYFDLLDDGERADLRQSINWILSIQTADGNFPSSSKHIGHSKGDDDLIHWCHGATGVVQLLIAAYMVFNDNKYMDAARKSLDLIWRKGILRKGPGICHGVSGNGYAFLLFYRLTGEEEFLNKAKAFAVVMMSKSFKKNARTPDSPLSLFEGWAGALCFLVDLLQPKKAQFPMVPINYPIK